MVGCAQSMVTSIIEPAIVESHAADQLLVLTVFRCVLARRHAICSPGAGSLGKSLLWLLVSLYLRV